MSRECETHWIGEPVGQMCENTWLTEHGLVSKQVEYPLVVMAANLDWQVTQCQSLVPALSRTELFDKNLTFLVLLLKL